MLVFAQQNAIFRSTNISIIWLGKIAIFHGMNGGWIIALSRFARMYMDMLSLSTYIRIQHWASYMLKQLSRSILHLNKYLSYFMKLRLWKMWCSRSFIWMVVAYLNWCWALTLSCCSNVIYISCSCTWDGGFFSPVSLRHDSMPWIWNINNNEIISQATQHNISCISTSWCCAVDVCLCVCQIYLEAWNPFRWSICSICYINMVVKLFPIPKYVPHTI